MRIGLSAIAHAYGRTRIDNVTAGVQHGFDEAFVREKLGIITRYAAAADQATSDLATEAARALLDKTGIPAQEIGALIVVTQTPDYQLPHTAALVQKKLGVPASVGVGGLFLRGIHPLNAPQSPPRRLV